MYVVLFNLYNKRREKPPQDSDGAEAQRSSVTYSGSHSRQAAELGLKTRPV